ncbi:unnamed protein product [Phytophthora lilii]|uniref:Unnamed protein product n=1 Tax=Phytophthora lilii TaxID=2077276 RepID=A0A9W6XBL1_9STRA|nr:unnamed protein product [Phytophthora lilii]
MLCDKTTIDTQPYRKNGSLSLPGGRKNGHQLKLIRPFNRATETLHLNDYYDCTWMHEFSEDLPIKTFDSSREEFEESSSEFINKVLAHLEKNPERIPAYVPEAMDLYAKAPKNYLYVQRTAPSHCPECNRTHDNADTLLLIFNESKEIALWKCAHNEDMKAKRWFGKSGQKEYEVATHDDDDVEAFANNLNARRAEKAAEVKKESKKADDEDEQMSQGDAIKALPDWDIKLDSKVIPPINDSHNTCCYADYLTMQDEVISCKEMMKYIFNNFALILNGGDAFFISKNFKKRADGVRVVSYQYLKYASIKNLPGSFRVDVINPETKENETHSIYIWQLLIRWQSHIAYHDMRFSPYGAKIGYDWSNKEVFNMFTGFVHTYDSEFVVDEDRIARYLAHIREAWCDDDEKLFEFTVKLFAHMVQFPHLKTGVAMIVMGPEGLGKNFVMELWRDHVIGDGYFLETPSIEAITGKFNAALEGNLMVVLNEASKVNKSIESNRAQEVVKDLITEMRRRYERKGHEAYMGECFNNVIMFSNNDYVVRASTEMRRFVFYKGSGRFIGKQMEHFAPIKKDFSHNDAGIHLYHYLMNIDLTGFHPQRSAPSTKVKEELRRAAIEKPIQWAIACINQETQHTFINMNDDHEKENFYSSEDILQMFNAWMGSCGERVDTSLKIFAKDLAKYFGDKICRRQIGGVRKRGFGLSINEMKELIAKTARRNDLFVDDE